MDLIEAMEEMEQLAKQPPAPARVQQQQLYTAHRPVTRAPVASPESDASWDFVLQQVAFVQTRLKALWQLKSRNTSDVQVPSSWVLSKLLRLIEEYPDGVTEAIVVTELMTLLQRKVYVSSGASASSKKIRNVDDIMRVLSEMEDSNDAVVAKLVRYDGYKLSLDAQSSVSLELEMYLHQRFRSCAAFLGSQPQFHSKSGVGFPFQSGRSFVFTNAKVMERKDIDPSFASGGEESKSRESQEEIYYLLPTQYLALHLNASSALDQVFARQAINLGCLDQLAAMQDQAILQQLVVKVKILDIGAIRPSQTPLHIYRQVIFLGEVSNAPAGSISNTQRVAQASHMMILWDDQVALSRLFHIGDELYIFQPYIHICEPHDTEIVHIFNEYSLQQRCMFYLEYGSATVLFLNPQSKKPSSRNANGSSDDVVARRESEVQAFQESELPPLRYEDIKHEWLNFSVYGHVSSIRVSHGTPLMAAYFYSYYDSKTNTAPQQDPRATASASTATPTLDRAIVSKFYLVVLLEIYNASSQQTLAVEVTGGNALKALCLRPGQTVFLDGLVAVDVQHPAIRKTREHGDSHLPSQVEAAFAFQSVDYATKASGGLASSLVALCSDWESIFGQQSMLRENSRLSIVSSMLGLLTTSLGRSPQLVSSYATRKAETSQMGMVRGQMCITYVGWLIPEGETSQIPYSCDITCQKGFSTMCAHKACMRHLELVPTPPISQVQANGIDAASPRWRCNFCQEIFSSMEETCQTFCELVVRLDDGSTSQPVYAICYGETIEAILGIPAQDFSQLSLHDKATILQQTIGRDFQVVLSRCAPHRVALTPQKHQQIDLRVDLIGPVDVFAAAYELLQVLQQATHR